MSRTEFKPQYSVFILPFCGCDSWARLDLAGQLLASFWDHLEKPNQLLVAFSAPHQHLCLSCLPGHPPHLETFSSGGSGAQIFPELGALGLAALGPEQERGRAGLLPPPKKFILWN